MTQNPWQAVATGSMLRPIAERLNRLGAVVVPVSGKYAVSVALDGQGHRMRNPDGSLVRWRPFVERFPTEAEREAAEWHRATGLALIVGPATWQAYSYLWVLDIEKEHRAEAEPWLDSHEPGWRAGVVVESGGGGLHAYGLHDRPVPTDPTITWGEIRGQGSLCVLPPSRHPDTGRTYQWLSERWTNLPQIDPRSIPGSRPHHQRRAEPIPEIITDGSRNATLTSLAGSLRHRGLAVGVMTVALLAVNAECCRPPLPDEEVRSIAASVGRYEPAGRLAPSGVRTTERLRVAVTPKLRTVRRG